MNTLRKMCSAIVILAMLVGFLPAGVQPVMAAEGTYNINSSSVTITGNGTYTINGSGNTTTNTITVNSDVTATITLSNVTIDRSKTTGTAFDIQSGANVTLILEGTNTLTGGGYDDFNSVMAAPGIHLPSGATLTIQGNGSLTVTGGDGGTNGFGGAGIGGNSRTVTSAAEACGTITILSGTVKVEGGGGGLGGVGIGGGTSNTSGSGGAGGNVTIRGGSVTITGGSSSSSGSGGAGIGGGAGFSSANGGAGGTVIITGGTVTVIGGNGGYGGAGIGGGASGSAGGAGGTVVILTPATITGGTGTGTGGSDDGINIGGGQGNSQAGGDGTNGSGIRPSTGGNNTYEVYGNLELPDGVEIPSGVTVTIPKDASLTVPEGTELVVDGTLEVETGGSLSNSGTISGSGELTGEGSVSNSGSITVSNNDFAANVSLNITSGGSTVTSATYGSTVTLTANITNGSGGNVTDGSVAFSYQLGTGNSTTIGTQDVSGGSAQYTIDKLSWIPSDTAYTITAVYTPASGSSLLSSSGSGTLSVSKATPTATPVGPISSSNRSETSITLNTVSDSSTGTYGEIQYGYTMGSLTTPSNWQDSTEFTGLQPGTDYTFYIRYKGNDFYNPSSPGSNTLVVTTNPKITTESQSAGHVGVNYEAQLTASVADGKNVTWSITSGSLPAGLELNGDTISGKPSVAGMSSITVQASIAGDMNGELQVTSTATLYIIINQGTSVITAATYNSEIETNTFTYGDTITVTGTLAASSEQPDSSNGINAITEPVQNQVGLYLDDNQLATANVDSDGSFALTYDTAGQGIPIGDDQTLTVKYGGSSDLTSGETTVTITLNKKSVTAQVQGDITKVYDGYTRATVTLGFADGAILTSGYRDGFSPQCRLHQRPSRRQYFNHPWYAHCGGQRRSLVLGQRPHRCDRFHHPER